MIQVKIEPGTIKIEPGSEQREIKLESRQSPPKNNNYQGNSKKRKNKPYNSAQEINMLKNKLNTLEHQLRTTRLMFLNAIHIKQGNQGYQNNGFQGDFNNGYQGYHNSYQGNHNNGFRPYHNNGWRQQPRNFAHQHTKAELNNIKQEVVSIIKKELKNDIINELKQKSGPEEDIPLSSLFIGIWDKTPITEQRLVELKRSIIVKIMKETVNGVGPRFNDLKLKSGWLQVTCKDLKSLEWMHNTIPLLKPWFDAHLTIKTCEDLAKSNKIVLHAPSSEAHSPYEAVSLLKTQNCGLDTDKWEMVHVNYKADTFLVHFNVSDDTVEELRRLDFKPFFGFKRALVECMQTELTDPNISQDLVMIDTETSVIEISD